MDCVEPAPLSDRQEKTAGNQAIIEPVETSNQVEEYRHDVFDVERITSYENDTDGSAG